MRTTQAARYARGSATLAVLLALFVSGAYIRHAWQTYKARASAPSAVPSAVEQQAAEFSFSKVTGAHAEFTVRASHAMEFAEGGRSLLQDVWVTFYGQDGSRADNLHTRSCELLDSAGTILCAGDVQIDLQSADDARQFPGTAEHPNPGAHIMHIHTSHVSFERATGVTASDAPVTFEYPQGHGSAVGLRYDSHEQTLRLLHTVDLNYEPAAGPGQAAGPLGVADANRKPLHLTADSLEYRRDQRVIRLEGPVDAQQGYRRLAAGHVDVELDAMMHARRIVASLKPRLTSFERADEDLGVSADEFVVLLSPRGWAERLLATGNVKAEARGDERDDHLNASRAELEMTAGTNQPRTLTATEDVVAESDGPGGLDRRLSTSRLDLQFGPDSGDGELHISGATTPAAVLEWQIPEDPGAKMPAERMHLSSQHLEATFGEGSAVREVHGWGGVSIERQIGQSQPQTSSSRELEARLMPTGDWSSVDLQGDVTLRQADQQARADAAHFDRTSDTATLKGSVALSNPRYRLTARSATMAQQSNEFSAEGDVMTSEIGGQNGGPSGGAKGDPPASSSNLAAGPARISANRLTLNTETGHAVYSEKARLWQGTSLIEADRIELDRTEQTLTANGHVRAVFPQATPEMPNLDPVAKPKAQVKVVKASVPQEVPRTGTGKDDPKSEFMRSEAGRLVYRSAEGRAVLDQGVTSRSAEGSMQSDAMELYFAPSGKPAGEGAKEAKGVTRLSERPAPGSQGPQELVRATALGHVIVLQGDRRATGAQADYTAADGKFVLSGGAPTVRDSSGNSASGRQLTLFFADDTIVIDSAEGTRTLTLHRVER